MPKQEFETLDYLGPIAVGIAFTIMLFVISFFGINFFCILKHDDVTAFERMGARYNMRLGPHRMSVVKQGLAYEEGREYDSESS
ncbi:unnamed protein product, partial [Mesorhabditis spiculigera]